MPTSRTCRIDRLNTISRYKLRPANKREQTGDYLVSDSSQNIRPVLERGGETQRDSGCTEPADSAGLRHATQPFSGRRQTLAEAGDAPAVTWRSLGAWPPACGGRNPKPGSYKLHLKRMGQHGHSLLKTGSNSDAWPNDSAGSLSASSANQQHHSGTHTEGPTLKLLR
jgi:hypothetical protein